MIVKIIFHDDFSFDFGIEEAEDESAAFDLMLSLNRLFRQNLRGLAEVGDIEKHRHDEEENATRLKMPKTSR